MLNKDMIKNYISVNESTQHGKPCVKGTRTPVHIILEALATGMAADEIRREYGPISDEAIRACILFAALLAGEEELLNQPA